MTMEKEDLYIEELCRQCDKPETDPLGAQHDRGKCLDKAKRVINGERQTAYGNPEDSFGIIAGYWETYLGSIGFKVTLRKSDVTLMMSLFKHARMSGQKYTEDNFIDATGYLGLSADFQAIESKTEGRK